MAEYICSDDLSRREFMSDATSLMAGTKTYYRADLIEGPASAAAAELGMDEFDFAMQVESQRLTLDDDADGDSEHLAERRRETYLNLQRLSRHASAVARQSPSVARQLTALARMPLESLDVEAAERVVLAAGGCVGGVGNSSLYI
jgi:hypothetical protein